MEVLLKEKPKAKEALEEKEEIRGLCLTCKANLYCTYKKGKTEAIVFCDEFDDSDTTILKPKCEIQNEHYAFWAGL